MASIHKQDGKPNFFAAFYDPEGFRKFKSTGTDNRRVATTIGATLERASRLARDGRLSGEKALKLVREAGLAIGEAHGRIVGDRAEVVLRGTVEQFVKAAGGELTNYTVRSWIDSWLAGRADASAATRQRYAGVIADFLKHLGARADRALTTLQPKAIEAHRDTLAGKRSPSSANLFLKVIKSALSAAVAKRQLEFSPAEHVGNVTEAESTRRPFTLEEINRLLKAANPDWTTMILLAFYTGQRLSDCVALTWRNVDLISNTISLSTQKTGHRIVLPLAAPLEKHLAKQAGDNPDAPLCPALHGKKASWLSNQFHALMAEAGLVKGRSHQSRGKGRDTTRTLSPVSFHSLRYSAVSELKNAGVSESIVMDMVGHDTAAVSRHYTKISNESKRDALAKLPDFTAP